MHLYMPMILLSLKMSMEYLFKNNYTTFFEQTQGETNSSGQVLSATYISSPGRHGQDLLPR
jgi:hypothetical protein